MHEHGILLPGNVINRADPLNRGLVSEWAVLPNRIGAGGSLTLRDVCGRNHGALTNGPTWQGPQGRPGGFGSLSFDDTANQYVNINSIGSFPGEATFIFQFNTNGHPFDVGTHQALISDGIFNQFLIRIATTAVLQFFYTSSGDAATGATTIVRNTWYEAAFVRRGSTGSWSAEIYLNGQSDGTSGPVANNPGAAANGTARIGSDPGVGFYFGGLLGNCLVFNRAFSSDEVSRMFCENRLGNPNRWNWIRRPYYVEQAGGGGGGTAFPFRRRKTRRFMQPF